MAKLRIPISSKSTTCPRTTTSSVIWSELIEGMSLRRALSQAEVLPAEVAAIVTAAPCRAAHQRECDVVHRDIKPENVLIALPDEQAT